LQKRGLRPKRSLKPTAATDRVTRTALNALYKASGVIAGAFLVAIAVMSLMQIGGRLLGFAAHSFDEFAGYCMAASSFLGLAWTFRCSEHIRMTLVIGQTKGGLRHGLEVLCLVLGTAMMGYFAWWALDMAWTSFSLNDVSQGLVPVKLWIPQSGMALGLSIMTIALLDDLLMVCLGRSPSYESHHVAGGDRSPAFER